MSNNAVLDFVAQFMPERMIYWNKFSYVESLKLARNKFLTKNCEHLVMYPDDFKEHIFDFKEMTANMESVSFILENSEAAYDALLYKEIECYTPSYSFSHNYDFIFQQQENYRQNLRNCKTVGGCFKKVLPLIPERYNENQIEGKDFFGVFETKLDTIHFSSRFEKINFSHDEVYLIPFFISYRNQHLLEWIYEDMAKAKGMKEIDYQSIYKIIRPIFPQADSQFKSAIKQRILKIFRSKGYSTNVDFQWSGSYDQNKLIIIYEKKSSGFSTRITKSINLDLLNRELAKLEATL